MKQGRYRNKDIRGSVEGLLSNLKAILVRSMFWGRGGLYKSSFHIIVVVITLVLTLTGIFSRISQTELQTESLNIAYGSVGDTDYIAQGSSIAAVVAVDDNAGNYIIYKHEVEDGQTLKSIADSYEISEDTIIWANNKLINPFAPGVQKGMLLSIPEIDGVLHEVVAGDTVDSVAAKYRNGNKFDIIELNELTPPNYALTPGEKVFIPSGEVAPPPLPGLDKSFFANPLAHPSCRGYRFIRGLTAYHSGIDLAKGGGCPIQAVAAGTVTTAGWFGLGGYSVIIDHGNNIKSYYYHGDGRIWVQQGDYVKKGQNLLYMGCSGNCTGTHLHLTLKSGGVNVNPAQYIPY